MEGKSGFRFCSPALCGRGRMRPCPALAAKSARALRLLSETGTPLRACLPGLPWTAGRTRLRCPARPLSCHVWIRPGSPPKDPVLLPAPRSRALLPVSPARSDQELARERERESAGAKRVDSKRLLPRGHRRRGAWTAATPGRWGGAARGRATASHGGPASPGGTT